MEGATHFILEFRDVYDDKRITTPIYPIVDLLHFLDVDNKYKDIAIWYFKPKPQC